MTGVCGLYNLGGSATDINWDEAENSSLSLLSPSWAVDEAILPNTFSKTAQLH
jgi:hypothetical protein